MQNYQELVTGATTPGKENKLLEHWLLGKQEGVQQDDVISALCTWDGSSMSYSCKKAVWQQKIILKDRCNHKDEQRTRDLIGDS